MKPYLIPEKIPDCIKPPSDGSAWAPPLDRADLAVRLESAGITSSVARSRYGYRDVLAMAETYLPFAQSQETVEPKPKPGSRVLRDYWESILFALPLLVCGLTAILFKASLWGGSITTNEAAVVAIATLLSFIVTGGFVQVIGRQGHFYREVKEPDLCFQSCWVFARLGLGALTLISLVALGANARMGWMPQSLMGWAVTFFLLIGTYLLVAGVLNVSKADLWLTVATVLGLFAVVLLHSLFQVTLLAAQAAGLGVAILAGVGLAYRRFRQLGFKRSAPLPSIGRLVYILWPYFAYGCLYYLFLFTDRFISWSTNTAYSVPVQFRSDYEAALDVSLIAFILQVGWVPVGLVRFYRTVQLEQKRLPYHGLRELEERLWRFYRQHVAVLFASAVGSTVLVLALAGLPRVWSLLHYPTLLLALAGMPFLVLGLWNSTALLFALKRPELALTAIGCAFAVDIYTGYALSRWSSSYLPVVGFDAGAVVFALLTTFYCRRLLANFDYHYFAATV